MNYMYTMGHKNVPLYFCLYFRQLIIDRFSKFFHCHILCAISNKVVVKYPTTLIVSLHYHVKHKFSKITKITVIHILCKKHILK